MRLDAKSGVRGMLFNAETGQAIRWCIWADIPESPEEQGEYEAWRYPPEEVRRRYDAGQSRESLVVRGRARLRFVPTGPRFACKPTSPRDLYESLDDARKRLVKPMLLIPGVECDEPRCHALASWQVSDEVEIEPNRDADGRLHERAVTVRVRVYCDRHFRLPTLVSRRGVESEQEVDVRPQW